MTMTTLVYAQNIAKSIAARCFPEALQFEVADDMPSVLSQISNMAAGMERTSQQVQQPALKIFDGGLRMKSTEDDQTFGMWCPVQRVESGVQAMRMELTTLRGRYEKLLALQNRASLPVGQLREEIYGRGQMMWFNKPPEGTLLYAVPLFL